MTDEYDSTQDLRRSLPGDCRRQHEYRDDVLNLQAMSLTYSTLLSLVPFLAVMFSVLKAFEVQNVLEPFLARCFNRSGPTPQW